MAIFSGVIRIEPLLVSLFLTRSLATTKNYIHKYATKTAYRFVSDKVVHNYMQGHLDHKSVEGCEAIQIISLIRHGSRFPGIKDIVNLDNLFNTKIKKYSKDAEILKWKPMFQNHTAYQMTKVGVDEQRALGNRFKGYFPELLDDPSLMRFVTSDKNRTLASCQAFQEGLGLDSGSQPCEVRNDLIRFFAKCEKYLEDVEDNDLALDECKKYSMSDEIQDVVERVGAALGLTGKHKLTLCKYAVF